MKGSEPRLADHEAIEEVLSRANIGFELGDADLFASAFAIDGEYQLDEKGRRPSATILRPCAASTATVMTELSSSTTIRHDIRSLCRHAEED